MINPPRHFLSSSLYRVRESLHHDHFESSITTIISKAVAQSQTVSYGKSRLLSNQKQLEITFPDTGELFNDINIFCQAKCNLLSSLTVIMIICLSYVSTANNIFIFRILGSKPSS